MISAIILAAGESKRMGQSKMLLPWGETTVLRHVINIFQSAEIQDILVIIGGAREQIESVVAGMKGVQAIYNSAFASGEMLGSIQCGLNALMILPFPNSEMETAALIGLGDQPQIQERSVRLICEAFLKHESKIVVPSYRMRRGHPWLVARPLWEELLMMKSPKSPRDFLNAHATEIEYVDLDTPTVVEDLDTPEDYLKFKP